MSNKGEIHRIQGKNKKPRTNLNKEKGETKQIKEKNETN